MWRSSHFNGVILGIVVLLFCEAQNFSQDIPAGVRYKRTTAEVNKKATDQLGELLKERLDLVDVRTISHGSIVIGPLLWETLKNDAGVELQKATQMVIMINASKPLQKEARAVRTPQQKREFWNLFMQKVVGKTSFLIKDASREDISYFWATIPFDIEEPLKIIDLGQQRVLVNFMIKDGEPRIFWLDIIGDLKTLK